MALEFRFIVLGTCYVSSVIQRLSSVILGLTSVDLELMILVIEFQFCDPVESSSIALDPSSLNKRLS